MSYGNSTQHADIFQFSGYSTTLHTPYHSYISDGSPLNGDDSNFWSSSPRSDSPSPIDDNTQIALVNSYSYFAASSTPRALLPDQRLSQYRKNYPVNASGDTSTTQHVHVPFVRVVKRRTTANKKERRRTQSINNAYADLRDCIPNVPPDTKLSKIKTLRLATSYINYLVKALESDDPTPGNFTAELSSSAINSRRPTSNSMIHHVNDCSSSGDISPKNDSTTSEDINKKTTTTTTTATTTTTRKAKGRTGWPQHVWALELEQDQAL